MRCDALTELEADRIANLLRCPRCGTPGRSLRSRSSWSPAQAAPARAPSWTAYAVGCRTARSLVGDIHFCNLDCPDDVLAERLRARPAWRGWNEQRIAEHQRFAASLRARIEPTFDTSA